MVLPFIPRRTSIVLLTLTEPHRCLSQQWEVLAPLTWPRSEYYTTASWWLDRAYFEGDPQMTPWKKPGHFSWKDARDLYPDAGPTIACGLITVGKELFAGGYCSRKVPTSAKDLTGVFLWELYRRLVACKSPFEGDGLRASAKRMSGMIRCCQPAKPTTTFFGRFPRFHFLGGLPGIQRSRTCIKLSTLAVATIRTVWSSAQARCPASKSRLSRGPKDNRNIRILQTV